MRAPVIDMHVHPAFLRAICTTDRQENFAKEMYGLYKTERFSEESLLVQMECAGIDKVALLPLDLTTTYKGVLGSNQEISELSEKYPDKFIGFASVDPNDPQACEKLEEAFTKWKLRGLKLHPSKQQFYPMEDQMEGIYAICRKYNKPIIFHSGMSVEPDTLSKYARPENFEEVAYYNPGLRFCLAHFGWPWIPETCMLLLKYPNVYADTALLYFDSAPEFYEQVFEKDMGQHWIDRSFRHQIMFGSDDPRLEMIRMKNAIEKMDMRKSTIDLILGKNAMEFLGMEAR